MKGEGRKESNKNNTRLYMYMYIGCNFCITVIMAVNVLANVVLLGGNYS